MRRGVGIRPGRLPLQLRRLYRARRVRAGVRHRRHLRAAGADRLPLGADRRRREGRRAHEGAVRGLAGEGGYGLPPRAPRRVRVQHGLGDGPRRQVRVRGRGDPLRRRRRGARTRKRRRRDRCADKPRTDRGGRTARPRPRAVGEAVLGDARAADDDRHPDSGGRRCSEPADVDVLEPAGGRGRRRSTRVCDRRRERAAGHPSRQRRAAAHRRRRGRHR